MDPLDVLALASAEFGHRLRAVADDQWGLPTPCEDWTVRLLVAHVLGGNHMAVSLLEGCTADHARECLAGQDPGDDPVTAYETSSAAQLAAFAEPGAFERTCHHPMGDFPGAQVLGFRIGDLTLHAWDLARATSGDEVLDPVLVEHVWETLSPIGAIIGSIGVFGDGPSGTLDDSALLQARMLDLAGRRP